MGDWGLGQARCSTARQNDTQTDLQLCLGLLLKRWKCSKEKAIRALQVAGNALQGEDSLQLPVVRQLQEIGLQR